MNRDLENEIRSFVLINFYEIKRSERISLIDSLEYLLSVHYKMEPNEVRGKLVSIVSSSKSPIELLQKINERFRSKSLR